MGQWSVALAQRPEHVERLDLGDDVELAALVALQRDVARRFETRAEATPGLADALGDGPYLAPPLGEDGDDPVGLAELDRPQDDAVVPVQGHGTSVVTP